MSKVVYKEGQSISQKGPKKKKYWWRYLLLWASGVFSCVLIIGLVALIISTTMTSGQVLGMFGLDSNAVLQPYYQGMSILQLATTLPNQKFETLGDIYQITPMAKDLILETVNPVLEKELHFGYDWDIISTKPFKLPVSEREDGSVDTTEDLSTYIGRAIKEGVYIHDFFGGNIPALVNLFLYPKDEYGNYDYDDPYCLMDFITAGQTGLFDKIIDSIKIKDVISNTGNIPILGEEGIGNWSLKDFNDPSKIDGLSVGLFIDANTTDPVMKELSTWTIGELKNSSKFDGIELSLFIGDTTDPIMKKISKWTVGKIKKGISIEDFDDISLSAFIGDATDPLLQELSKYNVGQLRSGSFVDELSLGLFIGNTEDKFLQQVSTWTIGEIKDDPEGMINDLSVGLFLPDSEDAIIKKLAGLKISDLKNPTTIKNLFLDLKISEIITVDKDTPKIICALVDKNYSINDLITTDVFSSLTIGEIFDTSGNRILAALSTKTLSDLEDEGVIYDLTLGEVLPATEGTIVDKFAGKKLSELASLDIHNILLTDIFTEEEIEDDPILSSLVAYDSKITIGKLSDPNTLMSLKLGDVMTDTTNPIINALVGLNCTIKQIPSLINTLSLGTVLNIDVNDDDTPLILKTLASEPINNIVNRFNTLTLGEIITINVNDDDTPLLMKNLAGKTIDQLNEYLPHIKLGDVMDFSSYPNLNNDTVKNTEINDFDTLINVLKNNLKLKDVVDIDLDDENTPKILKTLSEEWLYKLPTRLNSLTLSEMTEITKEDSHPLLWKLRNSTIDSLASDVSTLIPTLQLNEIITITEEDSHPLLWALRESTIDSLSGDLSNKILGLTLSQIMDTSSHPLLAALSGTKISDLASEIPNIALSTVITTDSTTPKLIKKLIEKGATFANLGSKINDMKLEDIIDIDTDNPDTPQILISLKDVKILDSTSLTKKINNLKLKDIYKESDCIGVFKYIWDENNGGDLSITQIPSAVNNLPLTKILEEYMYESDVTLNKYYDVDENHYYTYAEYLNGDIPSTHEVIEYRKITPIYWFLLTESGESFTVEEEYYVLKKGGDYTINSGLDKLTVNFTYHMQSESLFDLYDAGLIDSSTLERNQLDKKFYDTSTSSIRKVGDLTMSEFLALCISLIPSV